jgi:hydroxylamine reductase
MFCFQCQETYKNKGCETVGVCGKTEEVAVLQDALTYLLKGLSYAAIKANEHGYDTPHADRLMLSGLFSTITNVNFDPAFFVDLALEVCSERDRLLALLPSSDEIINAKAITWKPVLGSESEDLALLGKGYGILSEMDADKRSVKEMIIYGLKGLAAYLWHAQALGYTDDELVYKMHDKLAKTLSYGQSLEDLLALALAVGADSVEGMALLDKANTESYGHPEATTVTTSLRPGPAILITGHDLHDLKMLLEQTEGMGINIYTHGEMLPAHGYPKLKAYKHLAGHFGTAWHNQISEFPNFAGPMVFTTNCLVPPRDSYKGRIFTTGEVGFPDLPHVKADESGHKDFSAVIQAALSAKPLEATEGIELTVGFARNQVMQAAPQVIDAVQSGKIKRFVVMAGCDGRQKERNYYEEVARLLPQEAVILTAGCAKFRYNHLELGSVEGIPRLLDAGQCNDSYSLAYIALQLKAALDLDDINDLPISYDIAWYEQKAVCVLLALLSLGVKGIRLGPTLPAFITPNVAAILVDLFDIKTPTTAEADVPAMMMAS